MNPVLEALINTFPIAVALVVAIAVILRWVPAFNAATRYAVWWLTLFAIVAMPALFSIRSPRRHQLPPPDVLSSAPVEAVSHGAKTLNIDSPRTTPVLTLLWLAGAAVMLLRLGLSYKSLRRLKRESQSFPADLSQFKRPFRLLLSTKATSPLAVGFFHPAIIFPDTLVASLNPTELNKILTHEYAHLARRDDWMNLLARSLQTILWFHPLAWFILHQLELQRELACDDWVVHHTGDARSYAATLLHITELRLFGPEHCLATGFLGQKAQLSLRIEELLNSGRTFVPRMTRTTIACSALLLILLSAGASRLPAFIQVESMKAPRSPVSQSLLASLKASGYGDLDVEEIIQLKNNGVTGKYILDMTSALGKISTKDLIELHRHGVNPNHITRAREFKPDLKVEQIIRLKNSGVLD